MANDPCLPSNRLMDAAIIDAVAGSITQDDLKARLHAAIAQTEGRTAEPASGVPMSASGHTHERELRFHPESGRPALLLRAGSESELDELEASILGYKK